VLRVHDDTSISPLTSSGFIANDPRFEGRASRREWDLTQRQFVGGGLRDRPNLIRSIPVHITSGWASRQYDPFVSFVPDNETPPSSWISSTGSFEWAIWEIARRLTKFPDRDEVSLSVIRTARHYPPGYRAPRGYAIWAEPAMWHYIERKLWDSSDEDYPTVIRATRFAKASQELLWYGRIFASDVIQTSTWTRWETPIDLPEEFLIPPKHRPRAGRRWIDWLVFDPEEEGAGEAMEKISARRLQLDKSRGLHERGGEQSAGPIVSVSSSDTESSY
jgi:hypothetical protein